MDVILGVKTLEPNAKHPLYAEPGASGFDFFATSEHVIMPGGRATVSTGIALEIPPGFEVQARGRSGLAFKNSVLAHFGTIDSSFKGEIKIRLFNLGSDAYVINIGDRVAQGVLMRVPKAIFMEIDELTESTRGDQGWGSTGR